MVRFNVSIISCLFLILAIACHLVNYNHYLWSIFFAFLAILSAYGVAACVNDVSDFEMDKINLIGHKDRPLVLGLVNSRNLIVMAIIFALFSLFFSLLINFHAFVLTAVLILLSAMYSLKPFQVSHRPIVSPFYLSICYVVIPYLLGLQVANLSFGLFDFVFLSALYLLFLSKIVLKDFRDRKGDAVGGKSTMVLLYGKKKTLIFSMVAFVLSISLLIATQINNTLLLISILMFFVVILFIKYNLYETNDVNNELRLIESEIKTSNGMLLMITGSYLLQFEKADQLSFVIFYILMICLYFYVNKNSIIISMR